MGADDHSESMRMLAVKERNQPFGSRVQILQLALPHGQYRPSAFFQQGDVELVARAVAFKFRLPIISVRGGDTHTGTAGMFVPEATVHEHDFATRREYKVRPAGQVFSVQAIAIA